MCIILTALMSATGAANRPPLPKVARTRMTDAQLFRALDAEYPGMGHVLAVLKQEGADAGKAALASHFRKRTAPVWHIDPHARPAQPRANDNTSKADAAMRHEYRSHGVSHAFGPDIDWLDNPTYAPEYEFDKEWSMAFLRMPWWEDLGKAYWATGDEKYAREFVAQLLDFTEKHPIPVKRTGGSRHPLKYAVPEWRTLEIACRLSGSWTNSFHRFLTSPSFTDHALCEILKSFVEMARHLKQFSSTKGRTSNWTTAETLALSYAGTLFPEFTEAAEWRREARRRMAAQLKKQVYPDGVQWELAPGYGMGVLRQFRSFHAFAAMNGDPMPASYVQRLEAMHNYFLYSSVTGRCAAFGDSGHGDVRRTLALGAEDFPGRADFLWMATQGKNGTRPTELASAFPYAGQYVMRSGWDKDDRFMIVDAGPYGIAHQNEDNLSFELYAYGDWLVPDPGAYRYNYDSPWRHFMVSSLSHNTLVVDYLSQNRRSRRSTWVTREPLDHVFTDHGAVTYFRGTYDAGYGPEGKLRVAHTRSVFFVDDRYWVIVDRARPTDKKEHLYECLYMLQSPTAIADGNRIVTQRKGPNLLLMAAEHSGQTVAVVKGQMEPVRRGWKRGGKTVLPNPTAVIARRTAGNATFATLLCPTAPGEKAPPVKIEFVPVSGGCDPVAVRVSGPGRKRMLLVDQLEDATARVGGQTVRGELTIGEW